MKSVVNIAEPAERKATHAGYPSKWALFFVNIYRNITDINFSTRYILYVYTVQMQQKKNQNQNPMVCSRLQSVTSFSSASKRRVFRLNPWDSGNKRNETEVVIWNLIDKTLTHLFHAHN